MPNVKSKPTLKVVGHADKRQPPMSHAEREYMADLHRLVDRIYQKAVDLDWTWGQLAAHAGVSCQTVDHLGNRETKWPRYMTIYKLARAVGLDLALQELQTKKKSPKVASA